MVRFPDPIRLVLALMLVAASASGLPSQETRAAAEPQPVGELLAIVRPQPGESLWMEIPWHTSVWEARQQAAAEGKPLFIWAANGGGPIGVC
jgi:hypothetical protein